jgi:hypothetical protein
MAHPTRRLRGDCKKVQERTPISGEIGSLATFSDPSGNVVGLFRADHRRAFVPNDVRMSSPGEPGASAA